MFLFFFGLLESLFVLYQIWSKHRHGSQIQPFPPKNFFSFFIQIRPNLDQSLKAKANLKIQSSNPDHNWSRLRQYSTFSLFHPNHHFSIQITSEPDYVNIQHFLFKELIPDLQQLPLAQIWHRIMLGRLLISLARCFLRSDNLLKGTWFQKLGD